MFADTERPAALMIDCVTYKLTKRYVCMDEEGLCESDNIRMMNAQLCEVYQGRIMKCPRCKAPMRQERFYDFVRHFDAWQCPLCGEVIDPVVLLNRQCSLGAIETLEENMKISKQCEAMLENSERCTVNVRGAGPRCSVCEIKNRPLFVFNQTPSEEIMPKDTLAKLLHPPKAPTAITLSFTDAEYNAIKEAEVSTSDIEQLVRYLLAGELQRVIPANVEIGR